MVLRFSFLSARASGCCRGRLEAPSSSKRRQGRFVTEKSKKFFPLTFFSRLPQGVEGPARCREKIFGRGLFFFRSHLFFFPPRASERAAKHGAEKGAARPLYLRRLLRFVSWALCRSSGKTNAANFCPVGKKSAASVCGMSWRRLRAVPDGLGLCYNGLALAFLTVALVEREVSNRSSQEDRRQRTEDDTQNHGE